MPKETPRGAPPPDAKLLEHHFVFACIWAFGGCMLVDKVGWDLAAHRATPHELAVCSTLNPSYSLRWRQYS